MILKSNLYPTVGLGLGEAVADSQILKKVETMYLSARRHLSQMHIITYTCIIYMAKMATYCKKSESNRGGRPPHHPSPFESANGWGLGVWVRGILKSKCIGII